MMQSLDVGFHRILPLLKQVYNSTVEERTFIKSLEKMVRVRVFTNFLLNDMYLNDMYFTVNMTELSTYFVVMFYN